MFKWVIDEAFTLSSPVKLIKESLSLIKSNFETYKRFKAETIFFFNQNTKINGKEKI